MGFIGWCLELVMRCYFRLMDWVDASHRLPPVRIQLRPINPGSAEAGADPAPVKEAVDSLVALGFEPAGTYQIPALGYLRLKGLVHPAAGVIANVRFQGGNVVADITTVYVDKSRLTTSNSNQGAGLPRPPWSRVETHVGLAPAALFQKHMEALAARTADPVRRIPAAEYATEFERTWFEQQAWLAERGGYTRDELRSVYSEGKLRIKEGEMDFVHERMTESALRNWYAALPQPPVPVGEFDDFATDLLIIHDGLSRDRVEYLFDRWSGGMDMPTEPCTPRELFEALSHVECACLERIVTKESVPQADYYCQRITDWPAEKAA